MDPKLIEHTLLKVDAQKEDINNLCLEAIEHNFGAVCVPPYYVKYAKEIVQSHNIKVVTVIGFPFGYQGKNIKAEESQKAISDGADEVDMVMNLAAFKSAIYADVASDIESVATICRLKNAKLKVIIEISLLSNTEIIKACEICADSGADYVKTSTGFNGEGATIEAVKIMRNVLPKKIRIKAAGGIKSKKTAEALIEAGADRIGSSSGIELIK
jgi:deoxyribose-phosphate aldolase